MELCPICGETHSPFSHGPIFVGPFPPKILPLPLGMPGQLGALVAQLVGGPPPSGSRTHFLDRPPLKSPLLGHRDLTRLKKEGVTQRLFCKRCEQHASTATDCLWDYVTCTNCNMALTKSNAAIVETKNLP